METVEKEINKETGTPSRGVLLCRKLVAEKREMQEQAYKDRQDPKIQAIIRKQVEELKNDASHR
ncbi:hypothetical protein [Persicitalea sp.]|uniref:hypothetical protein n=1 Tax=Persicitalea sp. TaxID=3100273 RepID=UPI0035947D8B